MEDKKSYVGSIDQGTSSTRFVILNKNGDIVAQHQLEHTQYYPQNGWVEHDAVEIWKNTQACIAGALSDLGIGPDQLAAVGVTNQRETTVVWDAATGRPYHKAIVWNCARTASLAERFARELGGKDGLRAKTGLPLASYFSALKLVWLLENVDGLRAEAEQGRALFGTVDSWLLWNLSGGGQIQGGGEEEEGSVRDETACGGSSAGGEVSSKPVTDVRPKPVHVTDVSNASRTLLFNLHTLSWDEELLTAFRIPRAMLPAVKSSSEVYCVCAPDTGLPGVPVAGILGDQHAALFGQACFNAGEAKCTYGTGCFLMMNTGTEPVPSTHGLLTTVAYQLQGQPPVYALEGAVAVAGSLLQWLRDQLKVLGSASEAEALAAECGAEGSAGCVLVPAFGGLFAPHWREDARGTVCGLTFRHERKHLVKAALDAACFQAFDVLKAMEADCQRKLESLKVDGGMAVNSGLLQFQADVASTTVIRPTVSETTAVGAAYVAGLAVGFWADTSQLKEQWKEERRFDPAMCEGDRQALLRQWEKGVARSMGWATPTCPLATAAATAGEENQKKKKEEEKKASLKKSSSFNNFFDFLNLENDDDDDDRGGGSTGVVRFFDFETLDEEEKGRGGGGETRGSAVGRKRRAARAVARKTHAVARSVNPFLLLAMGVLGGVVAARLNKR